MLLDRKLGCLRVRSLWGLHRRDELSSRSIGEKGVTSGDHLVIESSSSAFSGGLFTVRLSTVHWIVRQGQHSPLSIPRLSAEDVLQYVVGVKVQTSLVMNSPDAVTVQQCWIRAPLHGWFKARNKPEGSRKAQ